ncbi:phosphotransferase family protein [Solimonas marina]|uniref:Phosphotransferase family protein n=1 Tax=Solimonas marina TaxID=2714601 RepID=A0A969WAS2_9GAMM|nr:phosphotransferase family protein [Solimonas marina]
MSEQADNAAVQLRSAAQTVPQDWPRLQRYLAGYGLTLDIDPPPRQFAGGFANLNYLVIIDGNEAVLRRPPMGPLPPGAYDMARESRILAAVHPAFPLAPRALHLCEDHAVLGAPFQISEFRHGVSVRDQLPPPFVGDASVGQRLSTMLVDVLAQLHRIDPQAIGLGELGRPQGFLSRAVEGWIKRATLATADWGMPRTDALIRELGAWMRANVVPDRHIVLLHNDYKLDNVLLDTQSLAPVAVVDWDQGTRGDGLFDLAALLSWWVQAGDPPVMHQLQQMPTAQPGFMTRREVADAYARATGFDLSDFTFHRVLAMFKTAVILQQLHLRYRSGGTTDPRYATFATIAEDLMGLALDVSAARFF